jgi:hypothetical protein
MPGFGCTGALGLISLLALPSPAAEMLNIPATTPGQLNAAGNRLMRSARLSEAREAYSESLSLDPNNLQAHLGMARVAEFLSDPQTSASHYSAAYRIAPLNPDVVLAFAGVVNSADARRTLLSNFLALSRDARASEVRAELAMEDSAGYDPRRGPLNGLHPARLQLSSIPAGGLVIHAFVDGTKELRLILDTGAHGVLLNRSAAARLCLRFFGDTLLGGYGAESPSPVRIAMAHSFKTGEVEFSNLMVKAAERDITDQADGVAGLDLFADYLIRLDFRARTLDLTPLDGTNSLESCTTCLRAYRAGHLLLVPASLNGGDPEFFILDSGAPQSVVSDRLVPAVGRTVLVGGMQGAQLAVLPSRPVSIRLGNESLLDFHYAALDTTAISEHNGIEIGGALGFSVLRELAMTIDYSSGRIAVSRAGRH